MKTFSMTHIGRRREMNQDYMYTSENAVGKLPNLFLVADGMGGHKAGEYASRFTVEKIVETIETSGQTEPVAAMKEAVEAANRGLLEEAGRDAAKAGMGTTVVAATVIGDHLHVANVGDSRLYLINHEAIRQITRDHSLVEEMVRLGGLTNMIEDEEIKKIVLGQRDIVEKAEKLIDTANGNGGKDNITVVLIEPFSDEVKEC